MASNKTILINHNINKLINVLSQYNFQQINSMQFINIEYLIEYSFDKNKTVLLINKQQYKVADEYAKQLILNIEQYQQKTTNNC